MRKWTETEAVEYLLHNGAEKTGAKGIFKRDGWTGLKACSAMDFLKRLNYTFKIVKTDESKTKKKAQKANNTGDLNAGICMCPGNCWANGMIVYKAS